MNFLVSKLYFMNKSDKGFIAGLIKGLENKFEGKFSGLENRFDGLAKSQKGLEGRFDGLAKSQKGLESRFDGLEVRFDDLIKTQKNTEVEIRHLGVLFEDQVSKLEMIYEVVVSGNRMVDRHEAEIKKINSTIVDYPLVREMVKRHDVGLAKLTK